MSEQLWSTELERDLENAKAAAKLAGDRAMTEMLESLLEAERSPLHRLSRDVRRIVGHLDVILYNRVGWDERSVIAVNEVRDRLVGLAQDADQLREEEEDADERDA